VNESQPGYFSVAESAFISPILRGSFSEPQRAFGKQLLDFGLFRDQALLV